MSPNLLARQISDRSSRDILSESQWAVDWLYFFALNSPWDCWDCWENQYFVLKLLLIRMGCWSMGWWIRTWGRSVIMKACRLTNNCIDCETRVVLLTTTPWCVWRLCLRPSGLFSPFYHHHHHTMSLLVYTCLTCQAG